MNFHDYLTYDPETGALRWKGKRCRFHSAAGSEAGSVKHDGRYRSFVLHGKRYYCHRVAWIMRNGEIPAGLCIDHIDGNGLNNRIENLRLVTRSANQRNKRLQKNSRTGFAGVTKTRSGYAVGAAGRYIGHFMNIAEAIEARKLANQQMGFHPNHGTRKA